MAGLFLLIVLLVLILTGAIVPVVIFGGWALVVILSVVFIGMIVAKLFGLITFPIFAIAEDIAEWIERRRYPAPANGDPDFPIYLEWLNGDWPSCKKWSQVKALLKERKRWAERPTPKRQYGSRTPSQGDPDYEVYLKWANREGKYRSYQTWEEVRGLLERQQQTRRTSAN